MNKRNDLLDVFKYFAAICIIFVHSKFPGVAGSVIAMVADSGVSFFFLISGYACYGKKDEMTVKIWKRFRRNGIILLFTAAAYFVFTFLFRYISGNGFEAFVDKLRDPKTYLMMVTVGDFDFILGIPLWYMVALLYCYLIFLLIVKLNLKGILIFAAIPLLLIKICFEIFIKTMPEISWHFGNNAIIGALPVMLLGYLIACYKDRIKIKNSILLLICSISVVLICLTVIFRFGGYVFAEPFSILLATSVFLFAIENPDLKCDEKIAKLGREDSLYIYLFHYMIALLITFFVKNYLAYTMLIRCILPLFNAVLVIISAKLISVSVRRISGKKGVNV